MANDYEARCEQARSVDLRDDIDCLLRDLLSHETSIGDAVGRLMHMVAKAHMRGTLGEPVYGDTSNGE